MTPEEAFARLLSGEQTDLEFGSWDYCWDLFRVVKKNSRVFFWASDAGCSCNWFGDGLSISDMSSGSRSELIAAFRKWDPSASPEDLAKIRAL